MHGAQTLQTLYARMIYRVADIRWEHRFEEVLVEEPTQCGGGRQLCIDFHRRASAQSFLAPALPVGAVLAVHAA